MLITAQEIVRRYGGRVTGKNQAKVPTPGHGPHDDGMHVTIVEGGEDVLCYSHNGGDGAAFRLKVLEDHGRAARPAANGARPLPPEATAEPVPISPVPADAPECRYRHPVLGQPSARYAYRNAAGELVHYVYRWDPPEGKKQILPISWCRFAGGRQGWLPKGPAIPTPLFNLALLARHPKKPVLVVEGEKCALAAAEMCGEKAISTCWSGGWPQWKKADFSPLCGRRLILWPDNDKDGKETMESLAEKLEADGCEVLVVRISDERPEGWDIADAVEAGEDVGEYVRVHAEAWRYPPKIHVLAEERDKREMLKPIPPLVEWRDDDEPIPPRAWLLGNVFCRGFISSLLADGGVGKTALRIAQMLALATGRPLTEEHVFQRCRVLIVSLEDGRDELRRRIRAARMRHGIKAEDIDGWLFLSTPDRSVGKLMTANRRGDLTEGNLASTLRDIVGRLSIDIVSLDPFIKTHGVDENSNSAMDAVVQVLVDLAGAHNLAVDIPHHTSKGLADPGNANRGRGASAVKDAGRLVYTLSPMTEDEAQTSDVPADERRFYVRMDSAKVNIAPMAESKWFKLVGVSLGNATETYPAGDNVQTVVPWRPPGLLDSFSIDSINRALNVIEQGLLDEDGHPTGALYTQHRVGSAGNRWAGQVIVDGLGCDEARAKLILKQWLKPQNGEDRGLLYETQFLLRGKSSKGLQVDNLKRPGREIP